MKKAITPVIAVILLIVMTVGIAAFTFIWMQNFVQGLQQQTQEQAQQLQRPQFTITYATADNGANSVKVIVSNIGSIPIQADDIKFNIEAYYKANQTYAKAVAVNKDGCKGTLNPNEDTDCTVNLDSGNTVNLTTYYYIITAAYRGTTVSYTLRK